MKKKRKKNWEIKANNKDKKVILKQPELTIEKRKKKWEKELLVAHTMSNRILNNRLDFSKLTWPGLFCWSRIINFILRNLHNTYIYMYWIGICESDNESEFWNPDCFSVSYRSYGKMYNQP